MPSVIVVAQSDTDEPKRSQVVSADLTILAKLACPLSRARAVLLAAQLLRTETGPAPRSIPFASRVRCLVALGACRRRTALGPGLLAAGPASD